MTATALVISFQSDNTGFICGSHFEPGRPGIALNLSETADVFKHVESKGTQGVFIWLHFNLSRAGYLCWLQSYLELPEPFIEPLGEETHSTHTEQQDDAPITVLNDVILDFERAPTQVATQWVYAYRRLLVALHRKSLYSADRLRGCVRSGETFRSPADLLGHLMCDQADLMTQITCTTGVDIDHVEDRFLVSKITSECQELAGTRRVLARPQRILAPELSSVSRLLARPPVWLHPEGVQRLHESTEEFFVILRDTSGLVERIKLLQEEVITRLDEQDNRTLLMLTPVIVLALPINIVAGFFGMDMGGMPLADNHHDFRLMVGLVAAFTVIVAWWVVRRRNNH